LLFATLILAIADVEMNDFSCKGSIARLKEELEAEENRRIRNENRQPRRVKVTGRKRFSQVIGDDFPEVSFRRYFRMGRSSFLKLASLIQNKLGDDVFRPEERIEEYNSTHKGAVKKSGGAICGEVRLAIFLRLLAGASYLDLMVVFDLSHDPVFQSFHLVCHWVHETFTYPLVAALDNEDAEYFNTVASHFAYSASDGIFKSCIGALDGWAVRIKRPVPTNNLRDPGAYFCRKGFFALNCQAICDHQKRIMWISSRHIGSCHDSVAFTDTQLYTLLEEKKSFLLKHCFFIVADSAYNMESFLLVPYARPGPQSMEDAYNYYHSNCRIRIECAFGEIVMRWGIFWRTLQFNLEQVGDIISAAALLHNFIVDERLDEDSQYIRCFSRTNVNPEHTEGTYDDDAYATVSDNNEPKPPGRPSNQSLRSREIGGRIRDSICLSLDSSDMKRPMQPGFKYNDCGMIYMDY
jgi:DDE superfamily endonuclease